METITTAIVNADVWSNKNGEIVNITTATMLMWIPGINPVIHPRKTPITIAMMNSRNIFDLFSYDF